MLGVLRWSDAGQGQVSWQVQGREPKTGQKKVQLYYTIHFAYLDNYLSMDST